MAQNTTGWVLWAMAKQKSILEKQMAKRKGSASQHYRIGIEYI